MNKILNEKNWSEFRTDFLGAKPFDHLIIDDFFVPDIADQIAKDFPSYDSPKWSFHYKNPIENKKASNHWDNFPATTYSVFSFLCSKQFESIVTQITGNTQLIADIGLHGGGWHSHSRSGNLNVHLDYNIHPKLKLQRKFNLIVYMTPDWNPEWGGGLELWDHDEKGRPSELVQTIENRFNRAVIFDTTQYSWHGLPEKLTCPEGIIRQSLAVYYVVPSESDNMRERALFVPHKDQENDPEILDLIEKRCDTKKYSEAYRTIK